MAKTVKIPDNMRPWEVTINGIKYVYPAGTMQEVPDEVAALIERISNVQPEKEPNMPPFDGGAQADLNAAEGEPGHVLNRTHWVESNGVLLEETNASTITHPTFGQMWLINQAPKLTVGETYTVKYNGTVYECVCQAAPAGLIDDPAAVAMGNFSVVGGANTGEPFAMLISFDYQEVDIIDLSGAASVKFGIMGEVAHKLDNRFLDLAWLPTTKEEPSQLYEATLSFSSGGYRFWASSEIPFHIVDGAKYAVNWNGVQYECVGIARTITEQNQTAQVAWLGNPSRAYYSAMYEQYIGAVTDTGEPFLFEFTNIDSENLWLRSEANQTVDVAVMIYEGVPNKLPEEFLPESVDGIIIRSSTADSTKKFKLTVDDSGTITATEI